MGALSSLVSLLDRKRVKKGRNVGILKCDLNRTVYFDWSGIQTDLPLLTRVLR